MQDVAQLSQFDDELYKVNYLKSFGREIETWNCETGDWQRQRKGRRQRNWRKVLDRYLRAAHRRFPSRRVDQGDGITQTLCRTFVLLPSGSRFSRPRYPRHLPRPSIPKGFSLLLLYSQALSWRLLTNFSICRWNNFASHPLTTTCRGRWWTRWLATPRLSTKPSTSPTGSLTSSLERWTTLRPRNLILKPGFQAQVIGLFFLLLLSHPLPLE